MIRDAVVSDFATILELNAADEHYLSPLDDARLMLLHTQATSHRVITVDRETAGFLLAFDHDSGYAGLNFGWFARRISNFMYIDRVVIDSAFRGRRLGSALYEDVIARARHRGIANIVCEYDLKPRNPGSAAFHAAMGFREVGQWAAPGGSKICSMQQLVLGEMS